MKKLVALMMAVMFTVGLASVALAMDPVAEGKSAKGKIVAVDAKASTITIDDNGTKVTVAIGAEDMKKAKEGMKAKVSYKEEGGKNVATKTKIMEAKAAQGC